VAFQCAITSAGKRKEINWRGLLEIGLPPLLILARARISSVSSGNSWYSSGATVCASTRAKSDFKEGRDAPLFAVIGFPNAEDMAIRATRCISNHHHSTFQLSEANHAHLAIVHGRVFQLQRDAGEDQGDIFKVKPSREQSFVALARIEGDFHKLL
jgi:hypothetical protein